MPRPRNKLLVLPTIGLSAPRLKAVPDQSTQKDVVLEFAKAISLKTRRKNKEKVNVG